MIEFGLSRAAFFETYFERAPSLHRQAFQSSLPSWADLDRLLHHLPVDNQTLQVFLNGLLPRDHYSSERREQGQVRTVIDKHRLFALLHQGATLVMNRLENHCTLTEQVCGEIGRFTGISTSCNSYVSWLQPKNGIGSFGKHWDTHDVFIVQLIGKKHWRIYPPTLPLPLSQHTSRHSKQSCPTTPQMELELHAGDVLYVPRGWWHEVTPLHTGSWHLSVGVYTPTITDYLSWLMQQVLPNLPEARAAVTHAALFGDDAAIALRGTLVNALQQALHDPQQLAAFLRTQQAQQQPHGSFNTALFMSGPEVTGSASMESLRVMRAVATPIDLSSGELITPTGQLRLDALKRDLLSVLNQHDSLSLLELMQQLPRHTRQQVRDAVWQLAVLEVLTLR